MSGSEPIQKSTFGWFRDWVIAQFTYFLFPRFWCSSLEFSLSPGFLKMEILKSRLNRKQNYLFQRYQRHFFLKKSQNGIIIIDYSENWYLWMNLTRFSNGIDCCIQNKSIFESLLACDHWFEILRNRSIHSRLIPIEIVGSQLQSQSNLDRSFISFPPS